MIRIFVAAIVASAVLSLITHLLMISGLSKKSSDRYISLMSPKRALKLPGSANIIGYLQFIFSRNTCFEKKEIPTIVMLRVFVSLFIGGILSFFIFFLLQ